MLKEKGDRKRETYDYIPAVGVLIRLPVYDFDAGCLEFGSGGLECSSDGWVRTDRSIFSLVGCHFHVFEAFQG